MRPECYYCTVEGTDPDGDVVDLEVAAEVEPGYPAYRSGHPDNWHPGCGPDVTVLSVTCDGAAVDPALYGFGPGQLEERVARQYQHDNDAREEAARWPDL